MSTPAVECVRQHSRQRGSLFGLLVDLAVYADDATGVAHPSLATLRRNHSTDFTNIGRRLKKLQAAKLLQVAPGGGRRHRTEYIVLCGNTSAPATVCRGRNTSETSAETLAFRPRNTSAPATGKGKEGTKEGRTSPELPPCPECGERVVIIDGSRGRFYGCSTYPTCKWKSNDPPKVRGPVIDLDSLENRRLRGERV